MDKGCESLSDLENATIDALNGYGVPSFHSHKIYNHFPHSKQSGTLRKWDLFKHE